MLPDPHADHPILTAGPSPEHAAATLLLIHGRGASAEGMLSLYQMIDIPQLAALAPQAAGNTWYPHSFLSPIEMNQPYLDSALHRLDTVVSDLLARGIASARIAILGFSQGACLATEFVARHPRRYGAVMGLLGGLIGPPKTPRDYPGSLDATPILLAASDPDPHIPFERVEETANVFRRLGASVDIRRYPGQPHAITPAQITLTRRMLLQLME